MQLHKEAGLLKSISNRKTAVPLAYFTCEGVFLIKDTAPKKKKKTISIFKVRQVVKKKLITMHLWCKNFTNIISGPQGGKN